MRGCTLPLLALLFGCGGTWSNRDLDFVRALPERASLKSKLPESGSAGSTASAQTRAAQKQFNGLIDAVLAQLDAFRQYPPGRRDERSRTWGPFTDAKQVGFEFRLVIVQTEEATFEWRLEGHELITTEWFALITGSYNPTVSLTEGQGAFTVHVTSFKSKLTVNDGFKPLDQIDVVYATDARPKTTAMLLTLTPGSTSSYSPLGYTSRALEDGSGSLAFAVVSPSNAQVTQLNVVSTWVASGAGRALGVVTKGSVIGSTQAECWSENFTVTYLNQNWPGGETSGSEGACVTVPGL